MSDSTVPPQPPEAALQLRSGTAARLAGLPVTTLRVWERRYGVVDAAKSDAGRRVYSPHDVARLRLLRQLTHAGHAIGTIAKLDLGALQSLAGGLPGVPGLPVDGSRKAVYAVVVGRSAAHALEAIPACVLQAVHEDLDQAEKSHPPEADVGMLLVRLPSLQPAAVERVLALGVAFRARAIFVIYAFATGASEQALRAAGVTVYREPVPDRELARWVRAAQSAPDEAKPVEVTLQVAPRQFGDEALRQLAQAQSSVTCECVRHMVDIVGQLAAFELYSRDCISTGPADAALHMHLARTAGAARTMFEQVLKTVVTDRQLGPDAV